MSIKHIVIGDIHGRDAYKNIDSEKYDKIIFVGDYVDTHDDIDNKVMIRNFTKIIQLKKDNPEKVILLLGNHCLHYMFPNVRHYSCSGFIPEIAADLSDLYNQNKSLFQVAYQVGKILITHAGISNGWLEYNKHVILDVGNKFQTLDLAETLNTMFESDVDRKILAQVGYLRGGNHDYGGIFWADRRETSVDPLDGYHQIVGHTPINRIERFGDPDKGTIRYIDVLGFVEEFYEFEA